MTIIISRDPLNFHHSYFDIKYNYHLPIEKREEDGSLMITRLQMFDYCDTQFDNNWNFEYLNYGGVFYFVYEEDMVVFKMRFV